MSKLYSIQEETLTSIGDALRNKCGETVIKTVNEYAQIIYSPNYNAEKGQFEYMNGIEDEIHTVHFPGAKKIQIGYKLSNFNKGDYYRLYHAFGEYDMDTFPLPDALQLPSVYGGSITYENVDTITFLRHIRTLNYLQSSCGYYLDIIGLDEEGYSIPGTHTIIRPIEREFYNLYSPAEMADEINNSLMESKGYGDLFAAQTIEIREGLLEGITRIEEERGRNLNKLETLELPDTITFIGRYGFSGCSKLTSVKMPHNDNLTFDNGVFNDCNKLKEITFYETPPTVTDSTFDTRYLQTIWVPGESYDAYLQAPYFSTKYRGLLKPHNNYVGPIRGGTVLFNTPTAYQAELIAFDEPPASYSVVVEDDTLASVSDITLNADSITFNVNDKGIEGTTKVILTVETVKGTVYIREKTFNVFERIPPSSYTVEEVDGAAYGFALNDAGYYESQCKGITNGYAVCRVNISNIGAKPVYFDCINSGEANYDYGLLSNINTELVVSNVADTVGVYYDFKGKSSLNVVVIEYTDAVDDCFITVKFRKDSSGNNENDSLQFKVRFGE